MKKFAAFLLFILVLVVSCRVLNTSKTESVLLYFCDPDTETICYRDLASDQPEMSFPLQHYFFIKWVSPEKVLFSKFSDSYDSEEYYLFDLETNSMECITCSLNSTSYKLLSSSMQQALLFTDEKIVLVDLNNPDQVESILSEMNVFRFAWSPNDDFFVFTDESLHLYRADRRDQALTELLKGVSALQIFDIEISPRADKVAFYLLDEDKNFSLAAVSVDGTDFQVLADLTPKTKRMIDSETSLSMFTWSPDGKQIAFTVPLDSDPTGYERGISVVDLDQGKPTLILESATNKISPTWSPDGSLIAFVDGKTQDIWTIAPDGTNLVNQTNTPERTEFGPSWK